MTDSTLGAGDGVGVGLGVGAAEVEGAGAAVTGAAPVLGIFSTCPMRSSRGSLILFSVCKLEADTPNLDAMALRVSPETTL